MTLENTGFFDQFYLGFVFRVLRENRQGVYLGASGRVELESRLPVQSQGLSFLIAGEWD